MKGIIEMEFNFNAEMFYEGKNDVESIMRPVLIKFSDGIEIKGEVIRKSLNLFWLISRSLNQNGTRNECVTDMDFGLNRTISFRKISFNEGYSEEVKQLIKNTLDFSYHINETDYFCLKEIPFYRVIQINKELVKNKIKHGIKQDYDEVWLTRKFYFVINIKNKINFDQILRSFGFQGVFLYEPVTPVNNKERKEN
jgi:hypothetical protein